MPAPGERGFAFQVSPSILTMWVDAGAG